MELNFIFYIAVLVMSVVVHEVSHGYAANALGDPTARYAGRLTLNPIKHIDILGSIIVPVLLYITNSGFLFGWAKPVPVNTYNLKSQRFGEAIVAVAGPLSNICLALVFGLLIRVNFIYGFLPGSAVEISAIIVLTNIALAVFNLMPVPPLDGSKILFVFLSGRLYWLREQIEAHSLIFILVVVFFLWQFVTPVIPFLFKVLTGVGL